eukprot:PhF_6_TR37070/c2_g2_i1/m.54302
MSTFLDRLFFPTTRTTDDYFERCRKIIATYMFVLTPPMVILSVPFLYVAAQSRSLNAAIIVGVVTSVLLGIPLCAFPYLWARYTKSWSENAMDLWIFSFNLTLNIMMVSFKSGNFIGVYYFAAFLDVACQTKKLMLHVLHTLFGLIVYKYNASLFDLNVVKTELRISGSSELPSFTEPVLFIPIFMFWSLIVFGTHSVLQEYRTQMERATKSSLLCGQVAEKLAKYSTKQARKMILESKDIDANLQAALIKIVGNLDMFRPHLPEYVWHAISEGSDTDSFDEAAMSTPLDASVVLGENGGNNNNRDDDIPSRPPSTRDSVGVLELSQKSDFPSLSFLGPQQYACASWAIIDFKRKKTWSDAGAVMGAHLDGPINPSSIRKLVNWCHTHAMKSHGTLHSFVGDTIHASWIFHSPTPKPMLFLKNMYNTFTNESDSGIFVSGALATGQGTSYMAGDRRQAYILHVTWKDVVRHVFLIARENITILLNERAFSCCYPAIACRCVDVLQRSSYCTVLERDEKIYEIISEREEKKVNLHSGISRKKSSSNKKNREVIANEEVEDYDVIIADPAGISRAAVDDNDDVQIIESDSSQQSDQTPTDRISRAVVQFYEKKNSSVALELLDEEIKLNSGVQ